MTRREPRDAELRPSRGIEPGGFLLAATACPGRLIVDEEGFQSIEWDVSPSPVEAYTVSNVYAFQDELWQLTRVAERELIFTRIN